MIDLDAVRALVPNNYKNMVNQSLVDVINKSVDDPMVVDEYRENFITYASVLRQGKYKMSDYVNAVKFVTYKLLDHTDIDAYIATFPDRYRRLQEKGLDKEGMYPYANRFKSSKLIASIMEQTIIPSYILNAPLYQKALNELSKIMCNSKSDIARVNAASAILQHTKAPEISKIQLDIGVGQSSVIDDLRRSVEELTNAQLSSLKAGRALKEIAESKIIDVDVEED